MTTDGSKLGVVKENWGDWDEIEGARYMVAKRMGLEIGITSGKE